MFGDDKKAEVLGLELGASRLTSGSYVSRHLLSTYLGQSPKDWNDYVIGIHTSFVSPQCPHVWASTALQVTPRKEMTQGREKRHEYSSNKDTLRHLSTWVMKWGNPLLARDNYHPKKVFLPVSC